MTIKDMAVLLDSLQPSTATLQYKSYCIIQYSVPANVGHEMAFMPRGYEHDAKSVKRERIQS